MRGTRRSAELLRRFDWHLKRLDVLSLKDRTRPSNAPACAPPPPSHVCAPLRVLVDTRRGPPRPSCVQFSLYFVHTRPARYLCLLAGRGGVHNAAELRASRVQGSWWCVGPVAERRRREGHELGCLLSTPLLLQRAQGQTRAKRAVCRCLAVSLPAAKGGGLTGYETTSLFLFPLHST